jgi:predicted esterase
MVRRFPPGWRATVSVVVLVLSGSLAGCHGTAAVAPSKIEPALVARDAGEVSVVTKPTNPTTPAVTWLHTAPPLAGSDWCIEEVSALDEDTCYVLPSEPTHTLLIYLHGIVPPTKESEQKTNVETVVAEGARRAGIAALLPRGQQGLAPRGRNDWWGWPTNHASYEANAAAMVAVIAEKRKKLEGWVGLSFSRIYLAGSSSGAYFATRLALHGDIEADGFGAMSGGSVPEDTDLERLTPKPFYVGYGKSDPARRPAQALAALLRGAGWPVREAAHPVGHGAKAIYLEEAFAFFGEHARLDLTRPIEK